MSNKCCKEESMRDCCEDVKMDETSCYTNQWTAGCCAEDCCTDSADDCYGDESHPMKESFYKKLPIAGSFYGKKDQARKFTKKMSSGSYHRMSDMSYVEQSIDVELALEVQKWAERLIRVEDKYRIQLADQQYQMERAMEEGFAEAYEMIHVERQKNGELLNQVADLKKKLKECGCSE